MVDGSGYWLQRLVFQRGLAAVYLVAFLVVLRQFRPLLGERGLTPAVELVDGLRRRGRWQALRAVPSVLTLRCTDGAVMAVGWTGLALALVALTGWCDRGPLALTMLVWASLWVLYLSVVNVGRTWYAFGWESLLLETGFLAIFLGPSEVAPPVPIFLALRWLLIRLELGAGLIKLRGDPCWRSLTCLYYHHETQPMPNPLSWYFHHLPKPVHRIEVAANHVTQLVVPFGLLLPQPVAGTAAAIIIVTQSWLLLSGNFAWLNALTIVIALSAVDGGALATVLPISPPGDLHRSPVLMVMSGAVVALIIVLSYRPAKNLVSRHQMMNTSFDRLHLVNSYGAFGTVTRVRHEIVLEGTTASEIDESTVWQEYEHPGKPGDVLRRPRQFAPYHLRLDWLLWFAALSPAYASEWFLPLVGAMLRNDPSVLRLLRTNPFPDEPPTYVRARYYRYRFTTRQERLATGAWWHRTLVGELLRPVGIADLPGG